MEFMDALVATDCTFKVSEVSDGALTKLCYLLKERFIGGLHQTKVMSQKFKLHKNICRVLTKHFNSIDLLSKRMDFDVFGVRLLQLSQFFDSEECTN